MMRDRISFLLPNIAYGIWNPFGVVVDAAQASDELVCQEPNVLYDNDPQILPPGNVWKMWYSAGFANKNVSYAESSDGMNWTKYAANPVIADHTRSHVLMDGATYVMFAYGPGGLNRLTSADGITWAVTNVGVLSNGAVGAWDRTLNNVFVWIDGSTWYMMYDGDNNPATSYQIGLATSNDSGVTWTKYAGNPVITPPAGALSIGHAWVTKQRGIYYCYAHQSTGATLPTDIVKFRSNDLHTWYQYPVALSYPRTTRDEGVGTAAGQVADTHIIEVGGRAYMFYSAFYDGSVADGKIKMAQCTMPLNRMTRSFDGMIKGYYPNMFINGGFERPGSGQTFNNWTDTVGDGSISRTTTAGEYRSGYSGLKITAGAAKNTQIVQSIPTASLTAGATYRISGYARGDGTNSVRIRAFRGVDLLPLWGTTVIATGLTFQAIPNLDFVYPGGGNLTIFVYCPNAAGGFGCVDDLILKRI